MDAGRTGSGRIIPVKPDAPGDRENVRSAEGHNFSTKQRVTKAENVEAHLPRSGAGLSREELQLKLQARNIHDISFRDERVNALDHLYATQYHKQTTPEEKSALKLVVSCHRCDFIDGQRGWGDLAYARKISQKLLKQFPGASITIVAGAKIKPNERPIVDEILKVPGVKVVFVDENISHEQQREEARSAVQQADTVIVGPSETVEGIADVLAEGTIHVTEYAVNSSSDVNGKRAVKSGIFGAGIFVESEPLTDRTPKSEVLKKYVGKHIDRCDFKLPENGLYFTYNAADPSGTVISLSQMHKTQEGDVKLVCRLGREAPGEGLFENGNDKELLETLRENGIDKVVIVRKGKEIVHSTGSDTATGKSFYIIDPFPLADEDLRLLIDGSGPLIGTTGDVSFSDVVAAGKIPVPHKVQKGEMYRDLTTLSKAILGEEHPLVQYLTSASRVHSISPATIREFYENDLDPSRQAQTIAALLNDDDACAQLQEGAQQVLGVLNKHYSLENYLDSQVCKGLLHKQDQALAHFHSQIENDTSLTAQEKMIQLSSFMENR